MDRTPRFAPAQAVLALGLALAALASSGCAVMMLGEGHEGGSGSLSDAARRASADSTSRWKTPPPDVGWTTPPAPPEPRPPAPAEPLPPPPRPMPPPGPDPGAPTALAPVAHPARADGDVVVTMPAQAPPRTRRIYAGLVLGGGALGGRDYDGFGMVGLTGGGYPQPRVRVDGTLSAGGISFTNQGYLGQAFVDPVELGLEVTARWYLTPDHTLLGLYPVAGAGTGTLFWDYAHPVTVIEDGEPKTLSDDRINHFSFFGGAGMSLLQTRWVHVGGNLVGGVRFYGWHTASGLKNDMLKTTGFFRLLFEVSFHVSTV